MGISEGFINVGFEMTFKTATIGRKDIPGRESARIRVRADIGKCWLLLEGVESSVAMPWF